MKSASTAERKSVGKDSLSARKEKSLVVTYLLWFFSGWFGIHHLYLGRDRQAFVWLALCGGGGGIGWMRDLWRIPSYVKQANQDPEYTEFQKYYQRKHPKPPFRWALVFSQFLFASTLGHLYLAAIPIEYSIRGIGLYDIFFWLVPIAVALGVHTVGNIGLQESDFKWPLIGAAIPIPIIYFSMNGSLTWSCILSIIAFHWKGKKWRRPQEKKRSLIRRLALFYACVALYYSLVVSSLYFNAEIQDKDGETIKLRDAAANFFKSPMWIEFKDSLKQLYDYGHAHGWRKVWQEMIDKLDPQGEKNALTVLGLQPNATQKDIEVRHKELLRKWHPDLHKDPEAKAEAQEKFIAVEDAYERLSSLKQRRRQKNESPQ